MVKLLINPHSFIDIVTNSSTELFVCETHKTIDQIKVILQKIVNHHNAGIDLGICIERKISLDDFIIYKYTKEEYDKKSNDTWKWGYESKENVGKILIEGKEDNIIPYTIFDQIENLFNARRFHLG